MAPITPVSKSSSPRRRGPLSLVRFGQRAQPAPRGPTAGARASRAGAHRLLKPSLDRRRKVRSRLAGSTSCWGPARPGSPEPGGQPHPAGSAPGGVGIRPRPARTSSGSPWYPAALPGPGSWRKHSGPSCLAAPATCPLPAGASRVISGLKSGSWSSPRRRRLTGRPLHDMQLPSLHMASDATISCNPCVFRLVISP